MSSYFWSSNGSFKIIHFSSKIFPNKVIQKNFLLSTFIQKGLQRFIKSLPNWNRSPSHYRAIPFSSDSWEINRSFLLPVYLIPPFPPAHLRWAAKLILKVKITATTSYSEGDYFPTIPSWNSIKEWPYNGHYFLFFKTAISANSSIGIYQNNSAFHGHKPPNNVWSFLSHQMPLSKGQNYQLNDQFVAPSLLAIPTYSCLLSPSLGL
jgi:hypothetical protein